MKKLIGKIGVDSGQVVVCDPCYIMSEWVDEPYDATRPVSVVWKGTEHFVDMAQELRDGRLYTSVFEEFGGKTMNELLSEGHATELPKRQTGTFSYDGCCKATNSEDLGGQLDYKMGHAGVAVAVSAGYGDGMYPVYAHYNKEGRVRKVEIIFI